MMILLCSDDKNILDYWKDNLTEYNYVVVENEDRLINILENSDTKNIIILEKKWIKNDVESLLVAMKGWNENTKVLFLSKSPSFLEGRKLLEYGINGYGNTYMQEVHMKDALHSIKSNNVWLYPEFIQQMIRAISQPKQEKSTLNEDVLSVLSAREKEIAMLVYEGVKNQEIADMIGITLRTVKAHTSSIYKKLHVKDRISLVLLLKTS